MCILEYSYSNVTRKSILKVCAFWAAPSSTYVVDARVHLQKYMALVGTQHRVHP